MKTQSEEEEEVQCNVAQQANDSVKKTPTRIQMIVIRVTHL